MELRSGSISSAQEEETIQNVFMDIVENIWLEIEKQVSMFFLEEQRGVTGRTGNHEGGKRKAERLYE